MINRGFVFFKFVNIVNCTNAACVDLEMWHCDGIIETLNIIEGVNLGFLYFDTCQITIINSAIIGGSVNGKLVATTGTSAIKFRNSYIENVYSELGDVSIEDPITVKTIFETNYYNEDKMKEDIEKAGETENFKEEANAITAGLILFTIATI